MESYLIALYQQGPQQLIFKDLSAHNSSSSTTPFANITLFNLNDEADYMDLLKANLQATSESSSSSSLVASFRTFSDYSNLLDALYALTVMPFFYSPTPYIGEAPGHGSAGFVEGIEATVNPARGDFSDCNENSLRVLLNLMIFDANKRQFNLAFLEKVRGPRVDILKEFYGQYQDVTNVGSTSKTTRTQWNRVVGDLNSFLSVAAPPTSSSSSAAASSSAASSSYQDVMPSSARVRYLQGNNELDSGFANFLRVFEKVLGLSLLPSFPETGSVGEKEAAIRQGFMALFKFIAPEKSVEINFNNLQSKPGDLAGEMIATVNSKFQFTLLETNGTHGHVANIKSLILQSSSNQQRLAVLERFETILQTETIATFILLQKSKQNLTKNPFYNLFATPIHGNGEALSFLEKLANMPADSRFNLPLKFVLKQIAWDDPFSREGLLAKLESMLGGSYAHAIFDGIRYFKVSEKYPIEFVEATMKNLREIEFSDESYVNIQNVMPTIKGINLPYMAQSPLDFSKLPNLESLSLFLTQISSVEFTQPMLNLKSINFPSILVTLTGIENLQALESLDLSQTRISSLAFTQPILNLKSINFPPTITDWLQVRGVENLRALEWVDLSRTTITSLEFSKPMPNLKTILLPDTIQSCTIYDKKENCKIKQLDFYGRCQAEEGKLTICLPEPTAVRLTFLGDAESPASSATPPS